MGIRQFVTEQWGRHPVISQTVGAVIIATPLAWGLFIPITGHVNPVKQYEFIQIEEEKSKQREHKYRELYQEVIRYADKDDNGYVSFSEQVDAWKRMGYEGPFLESQGASQFPKPELEDLEKAQESYKTTTSHRSYQ